MKTFIFLCIKQFIVKGYSLVLSCSKNDNQTENGNLSQHQLVIVSFASSNSIRSHGAVSTFAAECQSLAREVKLYAAKSMELRVRKQSGTYESYSCTFMQAGSTGLLEHHMRGLPKGTYTFCAQTCLAALLNLFGYLAMMPPAVRCSKK